MSKHALNKLDKQSSLILSLKRPCKIPNPNVHKLQNKQSNLQIVTGLRLPNSSFLGLEV